MTRTNCGKVPRLPVRFGLSVAGTMRGKSGDSNTIDFPAGALEYMVLTLISTR